MLRSLVVLVVSAVFASLAVAGQTCRDSGGNTPCEGTNSPCVCLEFSAGTPLLDFDFALDFSETAYPDATFRTGNLSWPGGPSFAPAKGGLAMIERVNLNSTS